MPALVVAPLALLGAFRMLSVNLLFPVALFSTTSELIAAACAPALVLFVASGLARGLAREISREYAYWRRQPCAYTALACGQPVAAALRRLVIWKSVTAAWAESLPWLYGELVVVEAVFNAPGLGLGAWHMARMRDAAGLGECVGLLVAFYGLMVVLAAVVNQRLGRRLASYG
jgi:ABC-type dipeptide/oligopeptide/nickel transport system permease component